MVQKTSDLFAKSVVGERLGLAMDATVRIKPSNLEKYFVEVRQQIVT